MDTGHRRTKEKEEDQGIKYELSIECSIRAHYNSQSIKILL